MHLNQLLFNRDRDLFGCLPERFRVGLSRWTKLFGQDVVIDESGFFDKYKLELEPHAGTLIHLWTVPLESRD